MRVAYWVAKRLDDSDAYTIREKTRIAVEQKLQAVEVGRYGQPKRVLTPDFAGSFDMLSQCLSEGGPWWEDRGDE